MTGSLSLPAAAHALASGLVGFTKDTLRVRILAVRPDVDVVHVVTADLEDAGTPLALSLAQVRLEEAGALVGFVHATGLVTMEGH